MSTATHAKEKIAIGSALTKEERDFVLEAINERDELLHTFNLRWEADMRAIRRWQLAQPGPRSRNELTWPDHADLVVWLLEQLEARK